MGKNQQMIKLFIVLLLSTGFIFSFSHFGAKAFEKLSNADGKFSNGTTIGELNISGKTASEAISLLEEKYLEWIKGTTITMQYQEKNAPVDINQFHLDAKQTVDSIKDGQQNQAFITINKSQVEEQVQILFPQLNSSDFDLDKLTTSLNQTASKFENGTYPINLLNDYLLVNHINKNAVLAVSEINLQEVPEDLQNLLEKNVNIEIPENSTFSLLEFVKKQKLLLNTESLSLMATGIYQTILPTNFTIIERNIGNTLPDFVNLGYEAKVNLERNSDLVFSNPNQAKYHLAIQLENKRLRVTLTGEKFLYNYKISVKDEQKLTPKTIVQYSPLLVPGKIKVLTKGAEGMIVKIYREVYQGDQMVSSILISEDYYPPLYQVEIHALTSNQQGTTPTNEKQGDASTGDQTTDKQTTPSDQTQQGTNVSDLWGKPNELPK